MFLAFVTVTSASPPRSGVSPPRRFLAYKSAPSPPPLSPSPKLCTGTCSSSFKNGGWQFVNNTLCQDGGADAIGAQCDLGTDCDDCGSRDYLPPP